ncbi:MAG TPA: hypothetical protein VLJ39_05310, partial [Tepidisphaeraceae bacterium]|nr:hypothetical protein [Tepidisphaeraceae bacterium]
RFERNVAAGKIIKLPIREEMTREETVELLPLDPDKIEVYVKTDNIPPKVRDALERIVTMKQTLAATQRQIDEQTARVSSVTSEQARIRENMKAVSPSTDYYNRLVKKLDEQETQIEGWQKELESLRKQLADHRKELETQLASLTIG